MLTVGFQIIEALRLHRALNGAAARDRAAELLHLVGIANPETRLSEYPHQFSGGMRQRVMIAMALSQEPRLLIADEPTTALDVTIQQQIIDLVKRLQTQLGLAVIWITHDLGVVLSVARRVIVMYAGSIAEEARTSDLFTSPRHPYTIGLLKSLPSIDDRRDKKLSSIPGQLPDLTKLTAAALLPPAATTWNSAASTSTRLLKRSETATPRPAGGRTRPKAFGARMSASRAGQPLVQVKDLKMYFPLTATSVFGRRRGDVRAVDGVSFEVARGETLA